MEARGIARAQIAGLIRGGGHAAALPPPPTHVMVGRAKLVAFVSALPTAPLGRLLGYAREWMTHPRTAGVAAGVLEAVLRHVPYSALRGVAGTGDLVGALLPYATRQFDVRARAAGAHAAR